MNIVLKKLKMLGDSSKINLREAFSDPSGKTSITAIMGTYVIFIGGLESLFATFTKQLEILTQTVIILGIGSALMGVRKIMNGKPVMDETSTEVPEDTTKTTIKETTVTNT